MMITNNLTVSDFGFVFPEQKRRLMILPGKLFARVLYCEIKCDKSQVSM